MTGFMKWSTTTSFGSPISHRVEQGHINLQETLIDDIARVLLAHPAVRAVRVSSEKSDVYEDVDAVGIEIMRFKDQP